MGSRGEQFDIAATGEDVKGRKQNILAAASKLLRHYGYNKTTVAEIAREASISVGSVYLEFNSKDAIIGALSAYEHQLVLDAMSRAAASSGPFGERLRAVFCARVEVSFDRAGCGTHAQDLLHCATCAAVSEARATYAAAELELLARLLAQAHTCGEFDVKSPDVTALALVTAHACFTPPWLFKQFKAKAEAVQALSDLHDLLLLGLKRR